MVNGIPGQSPSPNYKCSLATNVSDQESQDRFRKNFDQKIMIHSYNLEMVQVKHELLDIMIQQAHHKKKLNPSRWYVIMYRRIVGQLPSTEVYGATVRILPDQPVVAESISKSTGYKYDNRRRFINSNSN